LFTGLFFTAPGKLGLALSVPIAVVIGDETKTNYVASRLLRR
jgi:hypothetical protein